ncbi:hypothetical protein FB451DRAFT_1566953 [Mycena latifolia]|nr:hypothetical protein FB451DRAFT_1566953 [Mycena latifolia]
MAPNKTPKANAAAENSPPRATRQSRAKSAQVKAEREESAVPAVALNKLDVKKLGGDAPLMEVPSSHAIDHDAHLLFFNTYNEVAEYGSEIYSCNLKTTKWTKITEGLKYLPHSLGSPERERELPSRFGGAMAFYKSQSTGQRLLLLFGGQVNGTEKKDLGAVSNELIAVDIDARKWWVVDVAGGAVAARVEAQLAVVDDQLFVFGGKTYEGKRYKAAESYCIASLRNQQWSWDVRDEPYPQHVPALGFCCDSTVMHDGDTPKILLTVGYTDVTLDCAEIELLPHSFVVFDVALRTFTPQAGGGGTLKPNAAAASAVICTFHANSTKAARKPELYVYSPAPQGECRALGLRKRIAEAKRNFELFAVVGERLYLLGGTHRKWNILAEVPKQWVCG